jgi:hypothetical protein
MSPTSHQLGFSLHPALNLSTKSSLQLADKLPNVLVKNDFFVHWLCLLRLPFRALRSAQSLVQLPLQVWLSQSLLANHYLV